MGNRSFQVAIAALCVSVLLTVCPLVSRPGSIRMGLPTPEAPGSAADEGQVLLAQAAAATVVAPDTLDRPDPPSVERVMDSGSESLERPLSPADETPTVTVSDPGVTAFSLLAEEALHPRRGTGVFEELPPPESRDADAVTNELPSAPLWSPGTEVRVADPQPAGPSLERERLAEMSRRIDELLSEVTELRARAPASPQELPPQVLPPPMTNAESARDVEVDVVVLEVRLTGTVRDGVVRTLAATSDQPTELFGHALALDGFVAGLAEVAGLQWGHYRGTPDALFDWLNPQTRTRITSSQTLRLTPGGQAVLDIGNGLTPRSLEVRGPQVLERMSSPGWGRRLALEAAATPGGTIAFAFRPAESPTTAPSRSTMDWTRAELAEGSTLIVSGLLRNELVESRQSVSIDSPTRASQPAPSHADFRLTRSELLVLLVPRIARDAAAGETNPDVVH
jgi:hypothetical protein